MSERVIHPSPIKPFIHSSIHSFFHSFMLRIRAGEEIPRSYDPGYDSERQHWTARKSESLAKHAHGVILVVEADASYLENNTESLKRIREEFIANGNRTVSK